MPTPKAQQKAEHRLFHEVIAAVNAKDAPWPVTPGFENYWVTQQYDIRDDFRHLATYGRLPGDAAELATQAFEQGMVADPVVILKDGHASISYVPKFKNFEASVAYVLLRLSAAKGVHFGVCRKCGNLWYDGTPGKGRKREGFCSDAHRVAYNMGVYRTNKKKRAAARHK